MPVAAEHANFNLSDCHTAAFAERVGARLRERNVIDAFALRRAERAQAQSGERFDLVLSRLGLVPEAELTTVLSEISGLPIVAAGEFPTEALFADVLQPAFLKANKLAPLTSTDAMAVFATADPFNAEAVLALKYLLDRDITLRLTLPSTLESHIDRVYEQKAPGQPGATAETPAAADETGLADIRRLEDLASEAPVIRLVQSLIARAVEMQASDIHIEPREDSVRVRFRIDGALDTVETLPPTVRAGLASRIKIMSELNIAERRLPLDGRTRVAVGGREIDLRVSTMPTVHGESVVMRILDRNSVNLAFPALGFTGPALARFQNLMSEPNGIILVTGPTGSGKTTTLYTALDALNDPRRKLFTVEDPIEYQIAGINQIQVNAKIGLTFATALRSILRQDPDVIMVGEIRDLETAEMAVRASLTGHLVLSTVHTNSAAGTITRLLDMGVEDYLLASSLKGILAQRLVRKLCSRCSVPAKVSQNLVERLAGEPIAQDRLEQMRDPCGCPSCRNTGFSGRTTLYELLPVTQNIQSVMIGEVSEHKIEGAARAEGMKLLRQHGVERALNGETTLDEVLRATGGPL